MPTFSALLPSKSGDMDRRTVLCCSVVTLMLLPGLHGQSNAPDSRPEVTPVDIEIVRLAAQTLNSPEKWNRADNRECPRGAKTVSLYCALERSTEEVSKNFQHRGTVMEEARLAIEEIGPGATRYSHRLMDYNNDPRTTFADIQGLFWLLEKRMTVRLAQGQAAPGSITTVDQRVVRRVRDILDAPAKWNRVETPCRDDAKTFTLLCAFEKAEKDVTGASSDGAAIRELRAMITELDPNHTKYRARLVDYNADAAVTFANLQKLLRDLEERLAVTIEAK
jgi:hypothetical protein